MTQPIDTAYVDIVARDKSLKKLRADIDDTFTAIDKDIQKKLDSIDEGFDDVFTEIDNHFKNMSVQSRRSFDDVADEAESAFKRITRRFQEPLQKGFTRLTEIVSEAGRVIGQIGSGIGSFASSSPLLILILALTPAIIALAAALSQLIGIVGIIPAGFAVLLTAIIPVVVAFQNFGEAVSALASGDVDKINEALKKLSPSAAAVAREIASLLPLLRSFQRVVQEAFFSQVRGTFFTVLREIFPTMEKGFVTVATAMGKFVKQFAELLAQKSTIQVFQELFATTGRIIDKLSGPFTRFADMLLNTVHEALPTVEKLADAFGKVLDTFSAWVNKKIESGEFDKFIDDALTTLKELKDLIKEVGALIGTIFEGTETSGHELLKTLTDMVTKINAFLQTEDGRRSLELMTLAVQAFGAVLLTSAQTLIFFTQTFFMMMDFLEGIGRGFVAVLGAIGDAVTFAKDTIVTDFNNIMNFIRELPETIKNLAPKFLDAGKKLIQSFMNGFRAVGNFIGDIAGDIMGAVKGFLNKAIDKINVGLAKVDMILPGDLGRIPRLAEGAFVPRRPGGILANIGEGREDEWVLPDSKLQKLAEGSGQSITFGPGAININFDTVPTPAEAKQVGMNVGQGIIDSISKRNMRVQVRAV